MLYPIHRILRCRFVAVLGGALLLAPNAFAQTPVQNLPVAPPALPVPPVAAAPTTPVAPTAPVPATAPATAPAAPAPATTTSSPFAVPAKPALPGGVLAPPASAPVAPTVVAVPPPVPAPGDAPAVPFDPNAIVVNINGHNVPSDPAPQLIGGSVYVPLRGVLESLGAQVDYLPALGRIDIAQNGKTYSLRPGQSGAVSDGTLVDLAPSKMIGGRAFVPLRALAQLFGYGVAWQTATRTVAITSKDGLAIGSVDHREALNKAGNLGVMVDFAAFPPEELDALLDEVKASGATLIKFRFDWGALEPEKGAAFDWPTYDRIVKSARERGLTLIGILGDTAPWASVNITGDARVKRLSPPRTDATDAWTNYVTRVVGRYKNDVQAWQVWENPDALNFYSVPRTYRRLAALAIDAAHKSDKNAIIHLAEPGAVDLTFLDDLNKNGLTPKVDGISVYPVSSYQPGAIEAPEAFLRPYGVLRDTLAPRDGKKRDYWIGGVSYPALDDPNHPEFSERAQADFAVRALALGLAASEQKAFYNVLRDAPDSTNGRGLIRANGTPRLALSGVAALASAVGNLPFAGTLQSDDNAVVLLFDNKREGALVAWAPHGKGVLQLSALAMPSDSPNTIEVATRPDSQIIDSTGKSVPAPDGAIPLSSSPIIITRVGGETAKVAHVTTAALRLQNPLRFVGAGTATADLGKDGAETGINFRKYAGFGGEAQEVKEFDGKSGLTTKPATSALDPKTAKPFIHLDVDDDFLYNVSDVPVTLTVEVKRPPVVAQSIFTSTAGFRVEYDGVDGTKTTKWMQVEPGDGWATLTFDLPDAQFANSGGYDLMINAGGSKADLTFSRVAITRNVPTAIAQTP